jgi:hypothetical protein
VPVRTTTVVATGLVLLTLVGVGTIFGESLAALITPGAAADSKAGPTGRATAPSPPAGGSAVPARNADRNAGTDGGTGARVAGATPDGSS